MISTRLRGIKPIYFGLVLLIYTVWIWYMSATDSWSLFSEFWPASLTMMLGSFVAGATAEGGGAVAYPVFTKVLQISSEESRNFSLMIQSFGMGMASVFILERKIKIIPRVIYLVSAGGLIGMIAGSFFIFIPSPYPKILFTFITTAFGLALILNTYVFKRGINQGIKFNRHIRVFMLIVGIFGGIFTAQVGSGIDALTFMVLTLAFGLDEKISIPSTVIIMAVMSIAGFLIHGIVLQDLGSEWNYWLVSVPIVIIGAPLGAYAANRLNRHLIIGFLLFLVLAEFITTLLLIPPKTGQELLVAGASVLVFGLFFFLMMKERSKLEAPDE